MVSNISDFCNVFAATEDCFSLGYNNNKLIVNNFASLDKTIKYFFPIVCFNIIDLWSDCILMYNNDYNDDYYDDYYNSQQRLTNI